MSDDPWANRSSHMKCRTCMWFVEKSSGSSTAPAPETNLGRCRRHAPAMGGYPAMSGYPVVFKDDWCGDHKINENVDL